MSKTMQTALAGVVVAVVGRLAATGRIPKNRVAGIRIPSTMRSAAAWRAGHEAAAAALTVAGAGPLVLAVVGRVRTSARSQATLARTARLWLLACVGVATLQAHRAARAVEAR